MRDRWVGLQADVDARGWAHVLRRAHEIALASGRVPTVVREVIAQSWQRCTDAGVDPDRPGAPQVLSSEAARERWEAHPLSRATPILQGVLGQLLYDARHIVVVSDAEGCLLWSDGHPEVLRASEAIEFSPGHAWSEAAAGTNAVGTALAADHAVQVFSAEHYRCEIHPWQCSAAPVHDPETGAVLGVIDVTGSYRTAHPHNLSLVQTAAQLVESQLRVEMLARDNRILELFAQHTARFGGPAAVLSPSGRVIAATPPAWVSGHLPITGSAEGVGSVSVTERPDHRDPRSMAQAAMMRPSPRLSFAHLATAGAGAEPEFLLYPLGEGRLLVPSWAPRRPPRPSFRIGLLGTARATFTDPGGTHYLSSRHSEIVALLALHPEGLNARDLAAMLFGGDGHEVTVRVELYRLREVLGPLLLTRPYRLSTEVSVDLLDLQALLDAERHAEAVSLHVGPLLPGCDLPAIRRARARIAVRLSAHASAAAQGVE